MWEEIEHIDWDKYRIKYHIHGKNPPDILTLLKELISDDPTRTIAYSILHDITYEAYAKNISDLPLMMVYATMIIMNSSIRKFNSRISGLLADIAIFTQKENLPEPFKSVALTLKGEICKGVEIYQRLLDGLDAMDIDHKEIIQEDLSTLIALCGSA